VKYTFENSDLVVFGNDRPPTGRPTALAEFCWGLSALCDDRTMTLDGLTTSLGSGGHIGAQPMAFAGLWEGFKWPDGTVTRTFTIITTYANETVGGLHARMPAILEPEDWPTWLGEVEGGPAGLLKPTGDDVLWPVSKQVNSPRNNGAELLEAVG
jgi:hypothetical protein